MDELFLTAMKKRDKFKSSFTTLEERLTQLEETAQQMGIRIHYDRLEAAGVKLNGGICKINGEYHIFIDRRKSIPDKLEALQGYLENPLPETTDKV